MRTPGFMQLTWSREKEIGRLVWARCQRCSEAVLIAALMLICAVGGLSYLLAYNKSPSFQITLNAEHFLPSILWASGHGFTRPAGAPEGALANFLQGGREELLPKQIPIDLPTVTADPFSRMHLYLFGLVALAWHFFGIYWDVLKLISLLFVLCTIPIVYLIFRLGMNQAFSAAATLLFAFSPGVLSITPFIRDFARAPFILCVLLILGFLLKRPPSLKALSVWGLMLGLVQGAGLGFRHDVIMCLLPSVFVLLGCRTASAKRVWVRLGAARCAAIASMCAGFVLAGFPILSVMRHEGSDSYHNVMMGLATEMSDVIGLERASYEMMPMMNDGYCNLVARSFMQRTHGATPGYLTPESARAKREWLREAVETFPADFVTRAYAASLWVLRGPSPETNNVLSVPLREGHGAWFVPFGAHMERYGPWYVAAALLLLSAYDLRLAAMVLLLGSYFCYTASLQAMYRHVFYMNILSLWSAGFVLERSVLAARSVMQLCLRRARDDGSLSWRTACWRPLGRVLFFSLGLIVWIFVPLYLARAWQYHTAGTVRERHASARVRSIGTEAVAAGDWVLFKPTEWGTPVPPEAFPGLLLTHYLMVEFAPRDNKAPWPIRVECSGSDVPYSFGAFTVLWVNTLGPTRCFMPVYEWFIGHSFFKFTGIAVRKENAPDVKGLYEVTDLTPFPLLLDLILPSDPAAFRRYLTFSANPQACKRYPPSLPALDMAPSVLAPH